jgi:uncharacterized protein (TIGR03435 family)
MAKLLPAVARLSTVAVVGLTDQIPQGRGEPPTGAPPIPAIDPNGPSLFTALQEQLGFKLEPARAPVHVLVIDKAEQPTDD